MKSIIIYSSKYGCTKKIVKYIQEELECDTVNIRNNTNLKGFNIKSYDLVILGSSIYVGTINSKLKNFIKKNIYILESKKIALFISGLNKKDFEQEFNVSFSIDLRKKSIANAIFEGGIEFAKLNWFERAIAKKVMNTSEDICKIDYKKVDEFIEKIRQTS